MHLMPVFSRAFKAQREPLRDMIDAMCEARCTERQLQVVEDYLLARGYGLQAPHKPTASIYVIGRPEGPVKVGISSDPAKRLKGFQIASAAKLQLLHHTEPLGRPDANRVERQAHKKLERYAVSGEWFSCDATESIQAVESLMWKFREVGDVL